MCGPPDAPVPGPALPVRAGADVPHAVCLAQVPDDKIVERVVGRRLDSDTGKIYHMKYDPPPPDVVPPRLVHRSDDTEEKCRNRLKVGTPLTPTSLCSPCLLHLIWTAWGLGVPRQCQRGARQLRLGAAQH